MEIENINDIGYVTFNLKDYDSTMYNQLVNLVDKDTLRKYINSFKFDIGLHGFSKDDVLNLLNQYQIDDISNCNIRTTPNLSTMCSLQSKCDFSNSKKLLEKLLDYEVHTDQSWFMGAISIETSLVQLIKKIYIKIISDYYKDYSDRISHSQFNNSDLTLYIKGNGIVPHSDGVDENRVCAILIYLNDDYIDGVGGELIIDNEVKVKPIIGQIAILDFTKSNPIHSVEKVISDNFERFAFLKFVYQNQPT